MSCPLTTLLASSAAAAAAYSALCGQQSISRRFGFDSYFLPVAKVEIRLSVNRHHAGNCISDGVPDAICHRECYKIQL